VEAVVVVDVVVGGCKWRIGATGICVEESIAMSVYYVIHARRRR
jgi:hypothetical protein